MSSGFVSGGTIDEPAERDDEWLRVQRDLEEERRRKAEIGKQDGGKSLYEVLQQNKSESAIDSLLLRSPICSFNINRALDQVARRDVLWADISG